MDIQKDITVTLKPKEVEDIIKDYLKRVKNIDIDNVYFHVSTVYSDFDDRGSEKLTKIECQGKLK